LVERADDGYSLTADGRDLFKRLEPLGDWAQEWVPTLAAASTDD